ncbi:MAG: carboxypeptidase-like regulatory domain-containing protein [Planctomycetota bacterium]
MISFRRAFILATFVGIGAGYLLQRVVGDRPAVSEVSPTTSTLPIPSPEIGDEALSGFVDLPNGESAAGVAVVATTADGVRSATTDPTGRFTLSGLTTGEVRVDLIRPGFRPTSRYVVLPDPAVVRWKLEAAYPEVASLPRIERQTLFGRLDPLPTEREYTPAFEVWLRPRGNIADAALAGVVERRVAVDSEGRFTVEGLARGSYELALLPPFAHGDSWPKLVALALEHPASRGSSADLPLAVPKASSSVQGRLVDERGDPVEGATVTVTSTEDPDHLWPLALSRADGTFVVEHLVDGGYWLEIVAGDAHFRERIRLGRGYAHQLELPPLAVRSDQAPASSSSR